MKILEKISTSTWHFNCNSRSMRQKGFSLVELILALAVITTLAAIAIPNLMKFRRDYIFNDYASQIEYLIKHSKIYSMEYSTNIGICVTNNPKRLTIFNIGPDRDASICQSTNTFCKDNNHAAPCIVNRVTISEGYISISGSNSGSVVKIDPRGIAIFPGTGGNICISYDGKYSKAVIGTTAIRTENGMGGCS